VDARIARSRSLEHGAAARGRRRITLLAGALLLGACADQPPLPNLVLITIDTLRPDRLACYGGPEHVGTGLCSLGIDGARFVWAFAPASSTAPSIASVLTSLYPSAHAVRQQATSTLDDDALTVAELLSNAGYATAAFVSNPVLSRPRNLDQGFEIYDDRMTRSERNRRLMEREAEPATDAALSWARVARSPWFLWVHYQDPHGPYDPPGSRPSVEPPGGDPMPLLEDHSGLRGIPRYQALGGMRSAAAYEGRYLEEVRYVDLHVARLIAGLDALAEPNAILLTADHGEAFGEDDYFFAHGHSLGLDQIRVPLLVRPPGENLAPRVSAHPVSTLDVAPTLLKLAGLPIPPAFVGRALPLSTAEEAALAPERTIFAEHPLRLAVISGGLYYARDRWPLEGPVRDRISGGPLLPLPPRVARLGEEGRYPAYEPAGATSLETPLASFADSHPQREVTDAALAPDDLERLQALGYLE
jgi:arylsulfatase A-like enzyme